VFVCVCYSGRCRLLLLAGAGHYRGSRLPLSVCIDAFLFILLSFSSQLLVDCSNFCGLIPEIND